MAPKTLANGQAQNGQSSTMAGAKGARVKKAKRQSATTAASNNNNEADQQQENVSKSGNITKESPSKALLASAKPIITATKEPASAIAKNNSSTNNNVNTDGLTAHVNTFDTLATNATTQKQQVPATQTTKITNKSNQITSSSIESTATAKAAVAALTSPSLTTTASTTTTTTTTPTTATNQQQESTPTRNMINSSNSDKKSPTTPAASATPIAPATIMTSASQLQTAVNVAENEALNTLINNMTNDNISDCVSVTSRTSSARISTIDPEEGVKIDTARVQRRFSSQNSQEESSTCKICSKHVYQMERMMAEKNVYHKQCFRCSECKIQLRMDNYSSHESQLYCKAHHRQLFQPKAKFDQDNDVEPVTKSTPIIDEYLLNRGQLSALSYDPNNNQGGRWKQMVICENEPAELPKDVIRCETKVDDGIEALNLNLSNIRERFEQQVNESQQHQKTSTPIIDKPSINVKQTLANLKLQHQNSFDNSSNSQTGSAGMPSTTPTMVHRSGSLMMRLKRYESVISGEKNDDDSSSDDCTNSDMLDNGNNDGNATESQLRNNSTDIASVDLSSLKQKWESGHVNKNGKDSQSHEHKEELTKVRQSLALGRNQSAKNIYEKAVKEAVSTKPLKSDSIVLNFPSKANSLKEKFELGLVNDTGDSDTDEPTKLDQLRQEKLNDLSVFDEGEISAREARNLFKQIDRRLSSASQQQQTGSFDGTHLPSNNNESNGYQSLGSKGALINGTVTAAARRRFERQPVRCNTVADIGDNSGPIEVVKCSQPGAKEDISVETTRLREKFNFFENYREEPKTPRRFEMTPPREIVANGRKYSTVTNSDSSDEEDNSNNNNINGSLTNGGAPCTIIRSSRKSSSSNRLANGHHINGIVVDSNNNSNTDNTTDNDGIIKCSITSKLGDVPKTDTTRRMLDKFKQLEENKNNNTSSTVNNNNNTNQPIYIGNTNTNINLIKQNLLSPASVELSAKDGGRPCLKRITPPREYTLDNDSSDDEDSSDIQQRNPNIIRCADKLDDQIQVEPEKARSLRMKFENWAANQTSLDNDDNNNTINGYDGKTGDEQQFVPSVDTTRNLKAKFEAIGREENLRPVTIPRPQARVNRFVVKDMAE